MRKIRQFFQFKPFSPKQRRVLNWWCETSPVRDYDGIIADGAIRSGKTVSMSLSFVFWAMASFNGQNFAMCGKTIGSFRRNVLFWLKLMLKSRGYRVTDHRADNLIVVTRGERENYFYIFGGKDERSQDLIQGITLAGVFFDEVALMPESFVNQATGRCSVDGSKYWFNCNPDGPYHWFKVNWIDKAVGYLGKEKTRRLQEEAAKEGKTAGLKRLLYVHFTMDDNLSLSEKIKARYRSNYSGVFFKRYILGLWAMAEGIIYDMFDKDKHVVDTEALTAAKHGANFWTREQFVSCDYGTQNPTAFLLWNHAVDGHWYCRREYYYSGREKGRQKTDKEFSEDLTAWLAGEKIRSVVLDPAAASFKAQLEKDGFKVKKAKNDVLDGIRFVATLLNQGSILIDQSCTNLIKEFGSYIWDAKAAERGEDKPVKEHDHALDATRYLAYTIIRRPSGINILK
ncbi:MAG: PBSX family phage terminase large subunit [Eubacteriales bacterium]|nr:PBSX family phage terminase large subunit [Eubacteriales bacterium]